MLRTPARAGNCIQWPALLAAALFISSSFAAQSPALADTSQKPKKMDNTPLKYPITHKGDQVDDYFGTRVADPYRWLEDANSEETRAFVTEQSAFAEKYLQAIPGRSRILHRLTKLWNYERFGIPSQMGTRYFYTRNNGLQNQAILFSAESLHADPKVLLDPNKLSKDGTIALSGTSISWDGKLLAYSISSGGSDWQEWHIRDVATGKDLPDVLKWSKFSGASWTHDNKGIYYSRYAEPEKGHELQQANYFQKLYYHRIGEPQEKDTLIYERPDHKEWGFGGDVTEDDHYLIISVWQGTDPKNRVFYQDRTTPGAPVVELLKDGDAEYGFIGNEGPVFWFKTDLSAPFGRMIAIDTRKPEHENWKDVIPEAKANLNGVGLVGDKFLASYLQDAHTVVKVFKLDGTFEREVPLPGLGTAGGFGGLRKQHETFFDFASFTTPRSVFRYEIETGNITVFKQPKVDVDPELYETKQVFYHSKDGTSVPMFLTHRKGIKLDGSNPTLLYAYGGFRSAITPYFSTAVMTWLEMGGVYCVANLRGGSEFGVAWHEGGWREKKQNVFDDFIAAAEWLISEKYTSPEHLAIQGGSNGGLLVGACEVQRPDLFGACLPAVGVMDMLRFHKFTIGWAWVSEYGSSDNEQQFKTLYAYSPLHNIKPDVKYPATLITTGDHDDRVVPAHSFKFGAALQAAQAGPAPILLRIETRAGHGAGKPTAKILAEVADEWAFLLMNLNFSLPKEFGK